ncbi:MAG TPA: hypothetical protein VEZ41_03060 [Allosphingosinicella sp.]|jgi:hypothetical protein|nr:hypothetical protein [Allosphingosinicella sp.]
MSATVQGSERTAPLVNPAARAILLEQHYYEGGLKVRVLGTDPSRPSWVPPSEWVGFRNEVPLRVGDYVVEFVRFRHGENVITWVGLFHPSIDVKYGDRQNHAGIGVWLLDRDVLHGGALLQSLRSFGGNEGAGASENAAAIDRFVSEFLETLVISRLDLPHPLGGWPPARGEIIDTALFEAAAPDEEAAWALAAQQLLRLTILADNVAAQARAIVLIPHGGGGTRGLQPIGKNLAVDIVRALPGAFAAVLAGSEVVAREAAGAIELARSRDAEAAEARSRSEGLELRARELAQEVTALRSALDQSEPAQHYAAIRQALREVTNGIDEVNASVRDARRDLGGQIERLRQARLQRPQPDAVDRLAMEPVTPTTDLERAGGKGKGSRGPTDKWLIIAGICALLMILVSLAILYWPSAPTSRDLSGDVRPESLAPGGQP